MMRTALIVILCAFLSSSALAKGYGRIELEYNYQRPGGDYTHFITTSAQECARECETSRRCQAFDFYKSDNSCWLKNHVYPARFYAGVISGFKRPGRSGGTTVQAANMTLSHDTQRPGGDYTRFQAQSAQECAQKCVKDWRCVAFDYTTSDYFCYLKTWTPPARKYRGIVSGVKRRYDPQVKSVQELLIQQNYNPGVADGVMGRNTRIALENYQRDHRLFVSGHIDNATLIALGLRQSAKPIPKDDGQDEYWGVQQQKNSEVLPQAPSLEHQQQEISKRDTDEDLHLYIKTVGVTYLQFGHNIYANILAKIPSGTVLKVLSQTGEWYKVSYQNQLGYVLAESVQKQ